MPAQRRGRPQPAGFAPLLRSLGAPLRRGENVVLMGEVDLQRDPPAGLTLVSEATIKQAQRAEKEAEKMKGTLRARFDFLDDIS